MRIPRIAFLHYSCPPIVGGVETVVREQASLFHRHSWGIKVIAGAGSIYTNDYAVEINPLLMSQTMGHSNCTDGLHHLTCQIYEYLVRTLAGFDLLIAHNVLSMSCNLPVTIAIHRLAKNHVISVVGWNHDSPYFRPGYPSFLDRPLWAKHLKTRQPQIEYVTISESRRVQFEELYSIMQGIHVIPNGIDPVRFLNLDSTLGRLLQEQKLLETDLLIVQPARLHPRKNVELSLHVIRELKDMGLRPKLVITGAHDEHSSGTVKYFYKLKSLSRELKIQRDVLILAGYVFNDGKYLSPDQIAMRDLYQIADLVFLPSRDEGFGLPLLEAGMARLPVFCSSIPPFVEIGGREVSFFDLEEDPAVIAKRIIRRLETSSQQSFFHRIVKEYCWENIFAQEMLPFLQGIIHRQREQPSPVEQALSQDRLAAVSELETISSVG